MVGAGGGAELITTAAAVGVDGLLEVGGGKGDPSSLTTYLLCLFIRACSRYDTIQYDTTYYALRPLGDCGIFVFC